MATNSAEFEVLIDVITKNLVKAKKEFSDLTGSINETKKAHKGASDASAEHDYKLNQGVTGSSNASKSFSKLSQTIGSGPNGLVGAYATLAANAFAVSAAFTALRSADQVQQLMQGLEAQGNRTGHTLSLVSDSIVNITQSSLSAADAMRAAAQGAAAGLGKTDLEKLSQVAVNASKALGRNIPDSMDRIIKGVTKLEPELLDELGLMTKLTDATEQYARANGKTASSLTSLEKRKAFIQAIQKEGDLKFGGLDQSIDANKYDKLAATFENLKNKTLGWVSSSSIMNGTITLLTDSTYALSGVLALFGSLIGKQASGMLLGMADNARKAAVETKKLADAAAKAGPEVIQKAKDNTQAAKTGLADTTKGSKSTVAFKALTDNVASDKEGATQRELFDKATKSIEESTARYNKKLVENAANTTITTEKQEANRVRMEAAIVTNNNRIAAINKLMLAEEAESVVATNGSLAIAEAKAAEAAETRALAVADTLEAAAKLKGGTVLKGIMASMVAYKAELIATQAVQEEAAVSTTLMTRVTAAVAPVLNTTKVAFLGLSLGVKSLAIGFATILPWIGIISIAIGLIGELYDKFFKTDADKAREKAFADLGTVTEGLSGKIKELTRLQESQAQAGARGIQGISLQANALAELADAYTKASEASVLASSNAQKYEEAKKGGSHDPKIGEKNYLSSKAGIDLGSKTADLMVGVSGVTGAFGGMSDEVSNTLKSMYALEKLAPELFDEFAKGGNATETFSQKQVRFNSTLEIAKTKYGALASEIDNYKAVVLAAEQAQTDFLKSLKHTTSFDSIVDAFRSLDTSVSKLKTSMADTDTKDFSAKFGQVLTAIGPNTRKILKPDIQVELSDYDTLDARIQKLQADRKTYMDQGTVDSKKKADAISKELGLESDTNSLVSKRLAIQKSLLDPIEQGISAYTKQVEQAQQLSIISSSLVSLAQARANYLQRQGTIVGADVERQLRAQNSVIAMQAKEQEMKISFLKLDLDKNKLALEAIQTQILNLEILEKQRIAEEAIVKVKEKQNLQSEQQALEDRKRLLQSQGYGVKQGRGGQISDLTRTRTSGTTFAENEAALAKNKEQQAELEKPTTSENQKKIDALRKQEDITNKSVANLRASLTALNNNLTALKMGMYSNTEISLAAQKQNLANLREQLSLTNSINDQRQSSTTLQAQTNNLLDGSTHSLATELAILKDTNNLKGKQLASEYTQKLAELNLALTQARYYGNEEQIGYYKTQINLTNKKYDADVAALDTSEKASMYSKVLIESETALLTKKKDNLEYTQKIVDTVKEQISLQAELAALNVSIETKKYGLDNNPAAQKRAAIDAAEASYKAAKAEQSIKIQTIQLEFALLEAKKAQTIADLAAAKTALSTMSEKNSTDITDNFVKMQAVRSKLLDSQAKDAKSGSSKSDNTGITVTAKSNTTTELEKTLKQLTDQQSQLLKESGAFPDQIGKLDELISSLKSIPSMNGEALKTAIANINTAIDIAGQKVKLAKTDADATPTEKLKKGVESSAQGTLSIAKEGPNKGKPLNEDGEVATKLDQFKNATDGFNVFMDDVETRMKDFGPSGAIVTAMGRAATSISSSFTNAFEVIGDASASTSDKLAAGLGALSSVLSGVQSILKATSDAKLANIDKEIAAEEKRDGKSKASVDKINQLNKKKDDLARKSFETQKKLQMAQTVISTAAAIAGTLAASAYLTPMVAVPMAIAIGAMGAAELAIIAGSSYESSYVAQTASTPNLSIGSRNTNTVDLAKGANANAGGESAYVRQSSGTGSDASNYRTVGSAYGGDLTRGYGNRGFVVGEKGPEIISPETPINVTPASDINQGSPISANISIHALDSHGVQDVLVSQKGNIIKMLRDAANASGQKFMENVNVNVYTRPNIGKL